MKNKAADLSSADALREAITASLAESASNAPKWYSRLRKHLARVATATPDDFSDRDFLESLWSDESVSATGMGSVKVGPALDDPQFRQWFSDALTAPLPADGSQIESHLTALYKELVRRLGDKCGRVARLKLNRVLCARFPHHMTTLADVGALKVLHRAMGGASSDHAVHAHLAIRHRIEEVLGPVDPDQPNSDVERLCLPWFLYSHIERKSSDEDDQQTETEQTESSSGEPSLRPLPAALRRKGLTAVKGYFGTLLEFVQLLKDGLTREELADEVRRSNPNLSDRSVSTTISTITREFDLCVRNGDQYHLNARGFNLLETRDPDEFMDHLLTRILSIDHVIKALQAAPVPLVDLLKIIKQVNPGWTSDFMPRSIVGWLVSLDVIVQQAANMCALTERGQAWSSKITWPLESLSPSLTPVEPTFESTSAQVSLPTFGEVLQNLDAINGGQFLFPQGLVRQLHVGLWSHPVRHFAVLTGISGSGKTQLALNYGTALCGADDAHAEQVRVIPVQPGWFDPTPLLGYVSPLSQQYCSAPFLELFLRAAQDPERPYVVILDEMNLSHPEQYLAPLLSAMETRGWIDLHELPEDATDVPQRVRYPANLAVIGTLNMDETTHGLSDKVLDRAFTLEFWNISVDDFPGWERTELPSSLQASLRQLLGELSQALAPVRLHFGWRTIEDVLRYTQLAINAGATHSEALDAIIYARVLPKLRGENTERFHQALTSAQKALLKFELTRCSNKVSALIADLKETGMARFWR
jgi:5-methylcytosine-specific restriction enzyme B